MEFSFEDLEKIEEALEYFAPRSNNKDFMEILNYVRSNKNFLIFEYKSKERLQNDKFTAVSSIV